MSTASGRSHLKYEQGTPIWIRISEVEWRRAVVIAPLSSGRWSVRGDESRTSRNKFEVFEEDMCFRSENEHELMSNNLSALQDVTVPQVVNGLIQRFTRGKYATWGGEALVLVVPTKTQPPLTPSDHQRFKSWSPLMPPHILAVGAKLQAGVHASKPKQACVFVGEAGSGKSTALSTLVQHMCYLSAEHLAVCPHQHRPGSAPARRFPSQRLSSGASPTKALTMGGPPAKNANAALLEVGEKLDHALHMLGAMGCRATQAGRKSSRYGMLLELQYRHDDVLVGAKVTAALLDRSALSRSAQMTRSFDALHAVVHANSKYGSRLDVNGHYLYLHARQTAREVAADKRMWEQMQRSLAAMKISSYESTYLVHLLAAVLHLGNLEFVQEAGGTGAADIMWEDDGLFMTICELLCIDQKMLVSILYNISEDTHYQADSEGQARTLEAVYKNRDFLAQTIYGAAFDWLVSQVNALLSAPEECVRTVVLADFPGVLADGGYGTLCTNMVSELLNDVLRQQLVDSRIENFAEEGIAIPNLFAPNNSEVIDTVMSLLFLLSELPNTSTDTLMSTLANIQAAQTQNVLAEYDEASFTLTHTGGLVRYEIASLRCSAPCTVPDHWVAAFRHSTNLILRQVAIHSLSTLVEREGLFLQSLRRGDSDGTGEMPGLMKGIDTLKQQVSLLLDPLACINPLDLQLVSCLRSTPSDLQVSWTLHGAVKSVSPARQSTPSGVLGVETMVPQMHQCVLIPLIKWALLGYSEFIPLEDFVQYRPLVPGLQDCYLDMDLSELCQAICAVCMAPDLYQVGETVVVLKKGQTASLDAHLDACDADAAVRIQSWWRGSRAANSAAKLRASLGEPAVKIQALTRGYLDRKELQVLLQRNSQAARVIQGFWRGKMEQHEQQQGEAAETIQRVFRGSVGRQGAAARQKAILTLHRSRKGKHERQQIREQVAALKSSLDKNVSTIQRAARAMLAKRKTWRVFEQAEAACIIQEAYLHHYCRRWEAASKIQRWWRAALADLAIHWVLKQLRRSVFVAQFAYSSLKAKEIAQQYTKYEGAALSIQQAWRGKQAAGGNSNVLKVLEEQLRQAVDAAARHSDMQELQRVLEFAAEEQMEDLAQYIRDKQVALAQNQLGTTRDSKPSARGSTARGSTARSAPPPPSHAAPPPSKARAR